jgi:hypothetical protein
MTMHYSRLLLAIITAGVLFTACKKDNDDGTTTTTSLSATTANNVPGDTLSTGHYTFFRLKDSSIVALSDSATNKWDIGFRGTNIIVNGGTSGPGAGGAFIYNGLFSDVTTVPDSTFKQDNGTSLVISNWYTYTGTTTVPNHAILPLAGKVIILRTADSKYAKLEILSYYKGNPDTGAASFADLTTRPASRFYTFRYVYQPDGTKKLN